VSPGRSTNLNSLALWASGVSTLHLCLLLDLSLIDTYPLWIQQTRSIPTLRLSLLRKYQVSNLERFSLLCMHALRIMHLPLIIRLSILLAQIQWMGFVLSFALLMFIGHRYNGLDSSLEPTRQLLFLLLLSFRLLPA